MKKFPIALQLYSIRFEIGDDVEATLKSLKEMGYDGVELAGFCGKTPEEFKAICDRVGLTPISAHVGYDDMVKNPEILKDYATVGCKFVAIPALVGEYCVGRARHAEVVEGIHKIAAAAKELGMKLCYHNHDFEFQTVQGEYALDILYKECPPDVLQTELDLCWVNVGGENPAEYLRKYKGRAEIVHFKDFAGKKSDKMYALLGVNENEKPEANEEFEFRPLGQGLQNVKELLAAAEDAETEWIIIEQDSPSKGKTAMQCVKEGVEYLRSIM